MANRDRHRRFGNVRKRASGRFQVRYPGPDGVIRSAPQTFERKSDADRYLALVEVQLLKGEWIDPERSKIRLGDYAARWIEQRPNLRPRTVELYDLLLRLHIAPFLGNVEIGRLTTPMIRDWRTTILTNGRSLSMAAKAYRLLRAVLNTAVKEDELIRTNPCRIPGADQEFSEERPVLTLPQVLQLVEAIPPRFRALVLLTTFASLRWGEAIAVQRGDLDLTERTVTITKAYSELRGSKMVLGPPKTHAGRRIVSFPAFILPALLNHLEEFTDTTPDALVFTDTEGKPLRRSNFRTATDWKTRVTAVGVPHLHFHDLRHTGNHLAATTGASTRDLMARMGHTSPRAALIYQHATHVADRGIADALDAVMAREQAQHNRQNNQPGTKTDRPDEDDGTAGALVPAT
jgi:integrase